MLINKPSEMGALIRACRKELGWRQDELAAKIGTSRKWIVDAEKGKPGVQMGRALGALRVMRIGLEPVSLLDRPTRMRKVHGAPLTDPLNDLLQSLKRK